MPEDMARNSDRGLPVPTPIKLLRCYATGSMQASTMHSETAYFVT